MAATAYGHGAPSILHYRIKDGKVPFLGSPGMMKLKRKRKHILLIGGAVQGISLLVAAGATALTAAMAAMAVNKQAAVQAIRRGMQLFIESKVEESLVEFDKALELDPSQKPYLWQRGLSLYYLNRFEEAAAQFRDDIAVNPNDTEEAIWCFLAEAQLYGVGKARERFVKVGTDNRLVMRKTHELFKTGGNPENDLLSDFAVDNGHDYFYAVLYAGLYYESQKNEMASKEFITSAANSSYALRSNDYMAFLAKELLAIQQQGPRAIGFFGTRNMGYMHQQLIEILSYAMVITKNHIFTSGASGTNAAVIYGALRAERLDLLTVILPQSLKRQSPESQELLSKVKHLIEKPHNDHLPLLEASRLCNMDILSHVQQVICFAFHDSKLLMETCREAKELRKIVTLFYLD